MTENKECSYQIDYSALPGERILPFTVSLDIENSVLSPSEGEFQRFCYLIKGVGQDSSKYADLSHFLLDICHKITREDIKEITVSINDDPQTIIWGTNVEFKTTEKPDHTTGCIGLKFDFPLNKENGYMKVCISFQKIYHIGPVNVCMYGEGAAATGLSICGPVCEQEEVCEATFYQKETVCVPVKVTPFAKPGTARTICYGTPEINPENTCYGDKTSCSFTVSQSLCIELPISFGALVETGKVSVQYGSVSKEPCDCSESDSEEPSSSLQKNEGLKERRFFGR